MSPSTVAAVSNALIMRSKITAAPATPRTIQAAPRTHRRRSGNGSGPSHISFPTAEDVITRERLGQGIPNRSSGFYYLAMPIDGNGNGFLHSTIVVGDREYANGLFMWLSM